MTVTMIATSSSNSTTTTTVLVLAAAVTLATISVIDSWRLRRQIHQKQQQQQQRTSRRRDQKNHDDKTSSSSSSSSNNASTVTAEKTARPSNHPTYQDGLNIIPIGYVESCYHDIAVTPRQPGLVPSAKAVITLDKTVSPTTLEGLEEHSHIWVVFIFHKNNNPSKVLSASASASSTSSDINNSSSNSTNTVRHKGYKTKIRVPRNTNANSSKSNCKVGCLATRTPHRPNPVGLSLATIERVDVHERRIVLCGSDLLDGTPVIDIKPYVPVYDNPEILIRQQHQQQQQHYQQQHQLRRRRQQQQQQQQESNNNPADDPVVVRVPYFSDPKSFTRRTVTLADGLEEEFLSGKFNKCFHVFEKDDPPSRVLDAIIQTLEVDVSRQPNQTKPLKPYILRFDALHVEYVVTEDSAAAGLAAGGVGGATNDGNDGDGQQLPYNTHVWSMTVAS